MLYAYQILIAYKLYDDILLCEKISWLKKVKIKKCKMYNRVNENSRKKSYYKICFSTLDRK